MADKTHTIPDIPRSEVDHFRQIMADSGHELPAGDHIKDFKTGVHGVELDMDYDEPSQTLVIKIDHEGFMVHDDAVWNKLKSWGIGA